MSINEFQVEFEGITLGEPPFCSVRYEGLGSPELRAVESNLPFEDGVQFGQEYFGARRITINGGIKAGNPNTPSVSGDIATAWNQLEELITAWDSWQSDGRRQDRVVTKLTFKRPGRDEEYYAYGRPERIDPDTTIGYNGFITYSAQFRQSDRKFYSVAEEVLGISLSAPDTGGLVLTDSPTNLTNYITNPNVQTSSGTVLMDRNQIRNPSFETDTVGWIGSTNKSLIAVTGGFVNTYELKSTTTAATGQDTTWASYNVHLPRPGTYVVSSYMKSSNMSTKVASNFIGVTTLQAANTVVSGSGWARSYQIISASAGGVTGNVMIQSTTTPAASGRIVEVDGASVVFEPELGTYFDGATLDDTNFTYDWETTAHASRSTRTAGGLAGWDVRATTTVNMVKNPSFETGLTGWQIGNDSAVTQQTDNITPWGTKYIRVEATGTVVALGEQIQADYQPVTVGLQYTASAYVKQELGTRTSALRIRWRDASFAILSTSTGSSVTPSSANWSTRASVTATAPANAVWAEIRLAANGTGSIGDRQGFDAILFQQSATAGGYGDGSMSGWEWTGTANLSTSVQNEGILFRRNSTKGEIRAFTTAAVRAISSNSISVSSGDDVTAFADITGERVGTVGIEWLDVNLASLGVTQMRTASAPNNTAWARMVIDWGTGAAWDVLNWDNALLALGEYNGVYFSGDTATSGGIDYFWDGTANASISHTNDQFPGILLPFTTTLPTFREGTFTHAGTTDTWAVVTLAGPVTNPTVQLRNSLGETLWSQKLVGDIAEGETVTIDPRPWARTALTSGGANVAGALRGPRLGDMIIPPGDGEFVFIGQDSQSMSGCQVRFRTAWVSI